MNARDLGITYPRGITVVSESLDNSVVSKKETLDELDFVIVLDNVYEL